MAEQQHVKLEKIDDCRWRLPAHGRMNTDGVIYASESMIQGIENDGSLVQVSNVACLPGIVGPSMAMPDVHGGYGFPIGGVAAFDLQSGIVSPGGVGYDINCGVRLFRTSLKAPDIAGRLDSLVSGLFANIPCGVGSKRKDLNLNNRSMDEVLRKGAQWAVERGFGTGADIDNIEDRGCIDGADPSRVSEKARERGRRQLGTLGSGNHFVEVSLVEQVFDVKLADTLGLHEGSVTVTVHTGSRGLGYQVCDDFIKVMINASHKYGIFLPDRQLCCAPVDSEEGRDYLAAMACAANYAFANRQIIGHWVRETFELILGRSWQKLGIDLVYDVCHNIAKIEEHLVSGTARRLCVHRKGATRAFPPGHPDVPPVYRESGQPVLIPGDMGRCSYVLTGTSGAMDETFGSTCHGAGRQLSRNQARKASKGRSIADELHERGICVMAAGRATLAEEMPDAYKDVNVVVDVVESAGIGRKVVRLKPLGVIKG